MVSDAFGELVRDRLSGDDPALRKAYVALFVSEVAGDQEAIRISGSSQLLERAVERTEPAIMGMVPIFDQKWCAYRTHIGRCSPQKTVGFGGAFDPWPLRGPPKNLVRNPDTNPRPMNLFGMF